MSLFVKASGGITPNSADPGEEFPFLHTITVVDRVVSVDKPELVQNNIKNDTIAELRSQVQALNLAASQSNQNTYLIDRLQPCPTPAYVVPNPNGYYGCQQNGYQSCGC